MSQLDLSCSSGVTPRHLSFIETGRSRPGKDVVLRLANSLDLPLREQNEMLRLAGLSPAWQHKNLENDAMELFREVLGLMLKKHEPYPALVLDRWWNLVIANNSATALFPMPSLETQKINTVELLVHPGPIREMLENRNEVLLAVASRLRKEIHQCAGDTELEKLLALVENDLVNDDIPDDGDSPIVYTVFNLGDQRLTTMSTIARFSSSKDVFLNELRVEFVYPADESTRTFFESMAS